MRFGAQASVICWRAMEATFFVARRAQAMGIHAWTDLPCDPAAEPLDLESLDGLRSLAEVLGAGGDRALTQLTDATCRSFPVWSLSGEFTRALGALDAKGIEDAAARWQERMGEDPLDADLYELETLLGDLREAATGARPLDLGEAPELFVLLEQKAF